ncbi:MAG: response regulator [Chloroflexota bacterium]|nr:response regulator [Chloroflexota bacterium]
MTIRLRVLILEDRPADVELVLHELRQAGFEPEWQHVDTETDYLDRLSQDFDVILADYSMSKFNALQALHLLQERNLDVPFIVITGSISEETAVECMKKGAADYLLKDRLARLGPAVTNALLEKDLRDEKQRADESLRQRNYELAMLHRVGQTLTSTLDLSQVLDTVLEEMRDLLNAIGSSAWLIDSESDELICYQATGSKSEAVPGWRLLQGEGIADWVVRSGESLIVPDAHADERHFGGVDQKTGLDVRSVLCVPLHIKQKTIGVLQAVDTNTDHFDSANLALAEQLAATAAIAIENAKLYERAQQEIAERKRAEEALAHEHDLLHAVMDNMPDLIYFKDTASRFTRINKAYAQVLLGTDDPKEAIGKTDFDFFTPEHAQDIYADEQEIMRSGQPLIGKVEKIRNANFQFRWVSTTKVPLIDKAEMVTGIVGVSRDFTEIRQTEETLRRYAERLRTLHAIDGAILAAWSPEEVARSAMRHIRELVPCWRASVMMFDYETATQELGSRVLAALVDDQTQIGAGAHYALDVSTLEALQQGIVYVVEDVSALNQPSPTLQTLHAEGLRSYIMVPLIAQGKPIGSLNLGAQDPGAFTPEHVDIAREVADPIAVALYQAQLREQIQYHAEELEQRVAERTADLSAANAELGRAARLKDEFLASMSHELRTPLNAILGLSEALQEEVYGPLTDLQIKSLHTIETSGRHLLSLINDILDVSKIEAGRLELVIGPVSVESVCQASLALVKQIAHQKRLKVSSSFDSAAPTFRADMRRLKQILVNLLSNAVKFTHEGGAIGLEVVGDAEREVLHFTVWDTGIGIAPEEMDQLFEPFMQLDSSLSRQHAGTGLGLVLVRRIAEMHGGGVTVESELGKGSRFTVSLPWQQADDTEQKSREAEEVKSTEPKATSLPPHTPAPLLLLAEDNEGNIATISNYLATMGYRVIVARDGAEAVERAIEEKPDLILMDIQMPNMDGLEATRRIRANTDPSTGLRTSLADIPIVALTALAMPGDRERCLEAGANEYLSKPVGLKGLIHTIEAQLNAHVET